MTPHATVLLGYRERVPPRPPLPPRNKDIAQLLFVYSFISTGAFLRILMTCLPDLCLSAYSIENSEILSRSDDLQPLLVPSNEVWSKSYPQIKHDVYSPAWLTLLALSLVVFSI
ncbi:hypothetical protein BDQ12DRAFT_693654 [Crucibulum laeve]|uniref:Uncharacterized protein n=1 Tax=Crucibulum laeve TaxID=68775 RepID=A0A5C3LG80_9AGAR|nr:hypothetical protein BDQ12DRAFT_693654 [Crucibulum laeve]